MCYYSFLIKKAAVWKVFDFTDFIDLNVEWRLCWGITVVSDVYTVELTGCGHTRWAFFMVSNRLPPSCHVLARLG
jgi:hypothetical protein